MRRLCDILTIGRHLSASPELRRVPDLLARTHVVFADVVREDLDDPRYTGRYPGDVLSESPGCIPPYPSVFIEGRTATTVNIGVLVTSEPCDRAAFEALPTPEPVIAPESVRTRVRGEVYYGTERRIEAPGRVSWFLDDEHRPLSTPHSVLGRPMGVMHVEGLKDEHLLLYTAGVFAARVCAFMSASNVRVVERGRTNDEVPASIRAARRLAWIRYHVMQLRRGTEWVDMPSDRIGHGGTGLHTVRAHFRDYTEGPGHFGRRHVRFLVPAYARGNPDFGIVEHDYNLVR